MTSAEWMEKNPPTHTCRMLGGNVKPEQCEKRKAMAQERVLPRRPNPMFVSGHECKDLHQSMLRCAECAGPEPIKTHTYQRIDRFKPVDKKMRVRAKPKKTQQSDKDAEK